MILDDKHIQLRGVTSSFALWYGILAGPVVWLVHLFVTYGLATIFCSAEQVIALHVALVVASVIAISAGVIGWRARVQLRHGETDKADEVAVRRARFMANFAIGSSAIFLIAIVSQSIPNFLLDPCRYLP